MDARIISPLSFVLLIVSFVFMVLMMKQFFRKSVLYSIGISTATVIIMASFISGIQARLGPIHMLWALPLQIALAVGAYRYLAIRIKQPLQEILGVVEKISKGNLQVEVGAEISRKNNELGQLASAMRQLTKGLTEKAGFASEIGKGNLDATFEKAGEEDQFGDSLIRMKENLKVAQLEEMKRRDEDARRNWMAQGEAKFADMLRQNESDLGELSFKIISTLVKYMNINQGGIFVLNDESENDKYLELLACYAYDRRKFNTRRLEIGEGLLGSCFLEKKTTYITQLPQDYIKITSGLGDENPDALLMVPLKINEEVYGVIELASFRCFEPHEIAFAERVGEIIASAISGLKISNRTTLLLEKSQQQAEEMRAQEEEMRQNMEELNATQEALAQKEKENYKRVKKLEMLNRRLSDEVDELRKKLRGEELPADKDVRV